MIVRIGNQVVNSSIPARVEPVLKGDKTWFNKEKVHSLLSRVNPLVIKGEKVIVEDDEIELKELIRMMKNRSIKRVQTPYATLEISPSKMTSNMNVKWLLADFARLYKPLTERIEIAQDGYALVYEPETVIWWEIVIRHNQIGFYLVVPDKVGIKEGLSRQVMKCWKQSNVKEVKDTIPAFDKDKTEVTSLTLKYHEVLSLDTENPQYSILESLLNAKNYLKEGDVAVLQIGIRPRGNEWNDTMLTLLEEYKENSSIPRKKGKQITKKMVAVGAAFQLGKILETGLNAFSNMIVPEWEETSHLDGNKKFLHGSPDTQSTRYKAKDDAFAVYINVVAQCEELERRTAVVRAITSGFDPLEGDNKLLEVKHTSDKSKSKRLLNITSRTMPGNINDTLCARELSKIVNVPDQKAQIEHYNELNLVTNRGESEIPREVFDDGGGKYIPFATIEDTDGIIKAIHYSTKNKNHLCMTRVIMGEPGTGKTTAGINFALECFFRGYGTMYVDAADGKAIRRILNRIPPELRHKVRIINLADTRRPIGVGWNEIFRGKEAEDIMDNLAEEVVHFINLVSGKGNELNMTAETWIQLAVKAVWTTPDATIQDVMRMMSDAEYRAEILPTITDPELRTDWERYHNDYKKEERASICDQAFRRLYKLTRKSVVKNILLQKPKKDENGEYLVDFRRWMDEGYMVLVYADEDMGEPIVTTLVSYLLAKFNLAMISRKDIDEEDDRPPCFLFLDEPDHYIKGSERWQQMLTRYRKYRCGLVFMFHGWSQLGKTDKKLPEILRQAGPHYMVFQTDENNLDELKTVIEPEFKVKDVAKGMEQWHALIRLKMFTNSGKSTPCFMAKALIDPESRLPEYNNLDLYDKCADLIGEDRDKVKADIFNRGANMELTIEDLSVPTSTAGEGTLKKRTPKPVEEDEDDKRRKFRRQKSRLLDDVAEHMDKTGEIDEDLLAHMEELGLTEG